MSSNNEYAIQVQDVSKIYKLYDKPIDRLKESLSLTHKNYHKDFFALSDISFNVKKGETVGIIGTNGSGKSTILKIITGVLTPTSGQVRVSGVISALLELGAGFNMDYTGIENIYMNGTMMGFSKKQMDLNWDNPRMRREIYTMVKWWLEKGVDGFRLDVINYISKEEGLPYGNESVGNMLGYVGIEHYFYGPHLHDYLRELRCMAFDPYEAFSVGETPGIGMQMGKLLTGEDRHELDMIFSFDHLETPGHMRFDEYRYDLNYLKQYYTEWMEGYGNRCWMSLFYDNHDNPRMISKVSDDPHYRFAIGKLLGMIQFTLKGTPFLYQGQELGAVNVPFTDMSQIRDVESINLYEELCRSMSEEEAFRRILAGTRDHARAMMKWQEAEEQKEDRDSIYYFYKKLIALRKKYPALIYGEIRITNHSRKNLFTWFRELDGEEFYIECNLSEKPLTRPARPEDFRGLLSSCKEPGRLMQPYEACLYRKEMR